MRNLVALVLIFCLLGSLFAQEDILTPEWYKYNNPFEQDLDKYKARMDSNSGWLIAGVIMSSVAGLAAFIVPTARGSEWIDQNTADIINYSALGLGGVGITVSLFSVFGWKNNAEKYYQTLQLQTQYLNLINIDNE